MASSGPSSLGRSHGCIGGAIAVMVVPDGYRWCHGCEWGHFGFVASFSFGWLLLRTAQAEVALLS